MTGTLWRDAFRSLRRDRWFSGVAVLLLAVTIGALTAVYAVVHALVLRPFPFRDQDRVVMAWQRDDRRALPVIEVAHGEIVDWSQRTRSFDSLAVIGSVNWGFTLAGRSAEEPVAFSGVSAPFFGVVGTPPLLGRGLEPQDEEGRIVRTMVIGHGFWTRRLGGDWNVIGRTIPIKLEADEPATPVEIVGVMPQAFDFPRDAEAWLPAAPLIRTFGESFKGVDDPLKALRVFYAIGRMTPGVRVDAAARELTQVMRTAPKIGAEVPATQVVVTPIVRYLLGPAEPVLWTLLAGAMLMLAIACANVAGLQVSRFARRQRVLAIRLALGASARQLIGEAIVESTLLTMAAVIGAAGIARLLTRGLIRLAPSAVPRLESVALIEPSVLIAGACAALGTILVCGLWPALAARRLRAASALAHGQAGASDPGARRVQRAIVIAQVALALTLLAGTGLFLRTLRGLDGTVLGFNPQSLVAVSVAPSTDDPARWNTFYEALTTRAAALPGVTGAAAMTIHPLAGPIGNDTQPTFPGQTPDARALNPYMNYEVVTPDYFRTMGIHLVRGRWFTAADTATSPGVVVLGETAARRLWPGQDPLGQRLRDRAIPKEEAAAPRWQTVVGVVEDVRYRGLNDVRLDLYAPFTQSTTRVQELVVRAGGAPADALAAIRKTAVALDAHATVTGDTIMRDVVAAESAPWRFLMRVFVAFAALAGALATVGLGTVVAMAVTVRRRELAIRAALGATRARLRAVVLREGFALVGAGVALGLAGAVLLGRSVTHLLVGVAPYDPAALGAAVGVSALAALLAIWLPARRAADANPLEALKAE